MDRTTDRSTAKPDLAATKRAALTPGPQVVANVRDILGTRLTAVISGVKDGRTVDSWTRSGAKIPDLVSRRLQIAYAAILTLSAHYERDAIAAWFTWLADMLDDHSPASILASTTENDVENKGRDILKAARSHLAA
jgi:hypothetical protein